MGSRYEVEITIASATNLKNVNWRNGPVKAYAVVWTDPKSKSSSKVDEMGDTNPIWDQTLVVPFNTSIEDSTLFVDVVHANAMPGTKPLIGSVRLPLTSVVNDVGLGNRATRKLELKRPSGRPQGKLDVKVTVRQPHFNAPQPYPSPYGVPQHGTRDLHAAPAPAYGSPYGASPQPSAGYGVGAPPAGYPQTAAPAHSQPAYGSQQPSYGSQQPSYGGQQPGYGSQQPSQAAQKPSSGGQDRTFGQQSGYGQPAAAAPAQPKKNKFGMGAGLAMGAVAGALGAVAISGGIDYVEDKIDERVQDRVDEELGYDSDE